VQQRLLLKTTLKAIKYQSVAEIKEKQVIILYGNIRRNDLSVN